MGVTHKLHPNVIEFILKHKKLNSTLGCRQLAAMIKDQMTIKISKSSVNNLLKSTHLSGSVGRKPSSRKKTKIVKKSTMSPTKNSFEIPADTKERLSEVLKGADNFSIKPPIVSKKFSMVQSETREHLGERMEMAAPAIQASFDDRRMFFRPDFSLKPARELSGAGLVFLKAAQVVLMPNDFWSRIFKGPGVESGSFDLLWNVKCFLGAIDQQTMDFQNFENHAAYLLNDWSNASESLVSDRHFSEELKKAPQHQSDQQMISSEAAAVHVYYQNGESAWVDSQMRSIWGSTGDRFQCNFPIFHTIRIFSLRLVSQCQPIIFASAPCCREFLLILNFHDACENLSGREFGKAVIVDKQHNPIFEFPPFPRYKRKYLMGLWPWEFNVYFQALNNGDQPAQHKEFSIFLHKRAKIEAQEGKYLSWDALFDYDVRVIDSRNGIERFQRAIFLSKKDRVLWGVLTNDFGASSQSLIEAFLVRWPNGDHVFYSDTIRERDLSQEAEEKLKESKELFRDISNLNMAESLRDSSEFLLDSAIKMFFAKASDLDDRAIKDLFNLPGRMWLNSDWLCVGFKGSSEKLGVLLRQAADILNELDIVDQHGRKIQIFVD